MVISAIGNLIGGAGDLLGKGVSSVGDFIGLGKVQMGDKSASDRIADVVKSPFNLVDKATDYRLGDGLRALTKFGRELDDIANNISPEHRKNITTFYETKTKEDLEDQKKRPEQRETAKKILDEKLEALELDNEAKELELGRQYALLPYQITSAENANKLEEQQIKTQEFARSEAIKSLVATRDEEDVSNFINEFASQISQNNPNMGGEIVQDAVNINPNVRQLGYMKSAYNYLDKYFAGDAKSGDDFVRLMGKAGFEVSRDKDGNFIDEKGQPITRETFNTIVGDKMRTTLEEVQDYAELKMATDDLYKNAYNYGVDEYLKYSGEGNSVSGAKNQLNLFLERFTPEQKSWAALHRFMQDFDNKALPQDRLETRITGAMALLQGINPAYRLDFSTGEPALYLPDGNKLVGLQMIRKYIEGKDEITPKFDKWKESMEGAAKMREQEAQALQAKEREEVAANIERQVNELANFTGVNLKPIEEKIIELTSTLFGRRDYQPKLMRQAAEIIGEQKSSFQSIYDAYDTAVANTKDKDKIAVAGVNRDVALLEQYQKIVDNLNTKVKIDIEGTERKFAIGGTVEDLIGKKEYYRLMISQAKKNLSSWFLKKKTSSASSAPLHIQVQRHSAEGAKKTSEAELRAEIEKWTKKYEEEQAKETPSQPSAPPNLVSK